MAGFRHTGPEVATSWQNARGVSTDGNPTRLIDRGALGVALERRRIRLKVEKGPSRGRDAVSSEERLVIGSHGSADFVVEDPAVSRMHCEIVAGRGGHLVRDLGSTNGTFVDGLRVMEAFLPKKARLGVGGTEISFALLSDADDVPLHPGGRFGPLVGDSPAMRALFERLARVAPRDTTVLLEGESGSGKELAAHALHDASGRRGGPFVVIDCGSLPRTLVEAELFGHERGAFTGATQAREGAFARAHGGTLFLDEVGELDLDLQPRLLGAIERKEVKPIGAAAAVPADVRIVAATNRDLLREVNRGTFREDLYYRLAVVRAVVPPLRERPDDVPLLVRHFLEEHSRRDGARYTLDDATVAALRQRPWPGNVRELRNVVEQIVALGIEEVEMPSATTGPIPGDGTAVDLSVSFRDGKQAVVDKFELAYLKAVLAEHGGNITAAARAAGVDRVHFLRLLDKFGLRKPRA